jgi:hypothetical protein
MNSTEDRRSRQARRRTVISAARFPRRGRSQNLVGQNGLKIALRSYDGDWAGVLDTFVILPGLAEHLELGVYAGRGVIGV